MEQLFLFNQKGSKCRDDIIREKLLSLRNHADRETFNRLKRYVFFALLHKNKDKYTLLDKVIEQAKEKGMRYVLCKVSAEAKKFRDYARQVATERHQAIAFIRLKPIDQHRVLFGEFEIRHNTAEIIMLHFMERFPQNSIMLVFGEDVYIGRGREIFREKIDRKRIALPQQKDEFERFWLTFYKTQFIPERRNLRYLKRMIPKKYWRWVTELGEFNLA